MSSTHTRPRPHVLDAAAAIAAAALLSAGGATGAAAQSIDTRGGSPAYFADYYVGQGLYPGIYGPDPFIYTVGQTFTAPAAGGAVLDRFSFFLRSGDDGGIPETFTFNAYLRAWNPSLPGGNAGPVGPILYRSDDRTSLLGVSEYQEIHFFTGGIALDPGSMYVAFLSSVEHQDPDHPGELANNLRSLIGGGPYTAGGLVLAGGTFPSGDPLDIFQESQGSGWDTTNQGDKDLVFTADFSGGETPVPEPTTLLLLGTGLAVLARRRQAGR